ncbi:hypothetical protein QR680_010480 [Steinernema hermaphroditum]|uniref:Uncharacterized protein n=1 Tax=Steinernema hermaphroditum TaxID=289476 RepID=A0AA39MBT0_9BILA|nr:hypothetical protein QR680_010480 [Steinernema hermaphroditum]
METIFVQNIAALSEMVLKLTTENEELKVRLKKAEEDRDLYRITCGVHDERLADLTAQVEGLREENSELFELNATYTVKYDEFEAENKQLKEQIERLQKVAKSGDSALRNRVTDLEEMNDELLRKLSAEKKANKKLKGEQVGLKQRPEQKQEDQKNLLSALALDQPRLRKRLMQRSSSEPTSKRIRKVVARQPTLSAIIELNEEGEVYLNKKRSDQTQELRPYLRERLKSDRFHLSIALDINQIAPLFATVVLFAILLTSIAFQMVPFLFDKASYFEAFVKSTTTVLSNLLQGFLGMLVVKVYDVVVQKKRKAYRRGQQIFKDN